MGYSEVDPILDANRVPSAISSSTLDGEGVRYGGTESLAPEHGLNASISSLTTVLRTAPSARYPKKRQSDVEFAREAYLGRSFLGVGSGRSPSSTAIIGERVILKWFRPNGYRITTDVFAMTKR